MDPSREVKAKDPSGFRDTTITVDQPLRDLSVT